MADYSRTFRVHNLSILNSFTVICDYSKLPDQQKQKIARKRNADLQTWVYVMMYENSNTIWQLSSIIVFLLVAV